MDWISYIKEKEDEAISKIYQDYRIDLVNLIIYKYKLSSTDADEIFQASIVILYCNIFNGTLKELKSNSIKHYLFGICRNKVMAHFRLNKKELLKEVINDQISDYDEFLIFKEDDPKLKILRTTLKNLKGPCKTVIELFYFKKKTLEEITSLMNYKNINSTKNQKYKCIQRLRKIINNTCK